MMKVEPVTLEGKLVRLEPLGLQHAEGLYEAGQDEGIWAYMWLNPCRSLNHMKRWIRTTLEEQETGSILPFATIEIASGKPVGSTRYLAITPKDYGLEIGWTWLGKEVRRTGVNTECKYLLLRHAFETLDAIRVQLKTDSRNERSQRAMERIGAVREGTLRNHMILLDGTYRHSVFYSVIESEWPAVKARLERLMKPETYS